MKGQTPRRRRRKRKLPAVVVAPKNSPSYQAHSYPTKIPPEAITPFIEASTRSGDVVLDPFCGSGMTGVAALMTGRSAILSDLSPGATHLALNHTRPVAPDALRSALHNLDRRVMKSRESELYACLCPTCGAPATTRHVIWSDLLACSSCGHQSAVWESAGDGGHVPRVVTCPACGHRDPRTGREHEGSVPVQITATCHGGCTTLQSGPLNEEHITKLKDVSRIRRDAWMPTDVVDSTREMYRRSALHLRGIRTVEDFFLPRAKLALSELLKWISRVRPTDVRQSLKFAFTNTAWHASRMRRYNASGGQRPLTGTLYIPQLVAEANVFEVFRHQVAQVAAYYSALPSDIDGSITVKQSSATKLDWIEDQSIDYVFTDPPFGANIFYADCNLVWESWLRKKTNQEHEIVVNRSRSTADGGKTVEDYEQLLCLAFAEMRRVLRRDGLMSVVFHNSDDRVWSALLRAAETAGFRQAEVSILDKVQRSMKGYRGRAGLELVPFYDLVITFVPGVASAPALNGAGEIALDAVQEHLLNADRDRLEPSSQLRSLEYLYSLAVSSVVRIGASPDGLSFRAFEAICEANFSRQGRNFTLR